jgi:type III restriction enzyme
MNFVRWVRRAASDETDSESKSLPKPQQLVVFPAMELTLAVPCQALLIFDADFPEDLFALAATALTIVPSSSSDSKIAAIQRLNIQSLQVLKEELDKHTYLRGRYIVFPHVGESGQFSLLRKGQSQKYIEMPWVGGYVDGDLSGLGTGNQGIVSGKNKEWGSKRIACFQTSDSRSADHRDLARSSTWVKWALPTAEALR